MKKQIVETIKGRLMYEHIFKPVKPYDNEEGKLEYNLQLLIPKTDTETIQKIKQAEREAAKLALENGTITKTQLEAKNFRLPLQDGDEKENAGDIYKGMYYIRAKNKEKDNGELIAPKVVVRENEKLRLADRSEIYNGCYVYVMLSFFVYKRQSVGISCSFDAVCKHNDGEPIGYVVNIDEGFKGCETISNKKIDISGLEETSSNNSSDDDLPF